MGSKTNCKNRVGRPRKDEARTVRLDVRLTEDEFKRLANMSVNTGKTKSDIVREGLDISLRLHKLRLSDE